MSNKGLTTLNSRIARKVWVPLIAAAMGIAATFGSAFGATDSKAPSPAQAEARPGIETQRQQGQEKAQASLDREAMAAISETEKALAAVAKKDKKEALAAMERATGKLNILLARNQKTALIPVNSEVEVADNAPVDPKAIKALADLARDAIRDHRFGTARTMLDMLRSEIRVRTYNLPLATYPAALTTAARLVEEGKDDEATKVLMTALNTLVIVDRPTSIPLLEVQAALKLADETAQKVDEKEKAGASTQLAAATAALRRGEALGDIDDKSAKDFLKQIDDLERKVKGKEATRSAFDKLREGVASLLKKQAQTDNPGSASKP